MAKPGKEKEAAKAAEDGAAPVQTGGWDSNVKVRFKTFNGPAGATETLRIAMTKEAYADLLGHAKESLDREICGVLLGDLCEDDYGLFLNVAASLRGASAKAGGTHVTFTQETWNEIHKAKEARHPKLQIVGWYHSHPGFGVEFSDMDLFIQKNFFGGTGQVALVTDHLGGDEAIIANVDGRIESVKRFWVNGRERKLYVPPSAASSDIAPIAAAVGTTAMAMPTEVKRSLEELQDRVRQLTEAVEKQRNFFYNTWTFVGMLVAMCVILATGWTLWASYMDKRKPPEEMMNVRAMMPVNGKPTWVTLSVKGWEMSQEHETEMERIFIEKFVATLTPEKIEMLRAAADEMAKQKAAATQKSATTQKSPATAPAAR